MHLFLMLREARKSRIKGPTDLVSAEGLLPGSQIGVSSLCPHRVQGVRGSLDLLIRAVIPS